MTIEPRVGGRVFATHGDGEEHAWGQVTAWEPPHRLAYASTLAQDGDRPSEATVTFTPAAPGTHMRFEHGGWTAENEGDRHKFSDWPRILERFVHLLGPARS